MQAKGEKTGASANRVQPKILSAAKPPFYSTKVVEEPKNKTDMPKFLSNFSTILIFCFLILQSCSPSEKKKENLDHPNVLFIAIDDLNDWIEPLAGNDQTITPHLKKFADEGVNFTANYCTSPGCNPSRSTLLTGIHTFNSGMYSNYQDWRKVPLLKNVPTLGHYFRQHGYFTAGAGKIFHYSQVDTLAWNAYFPSIKKPMPADIFPDTFPANMPRFKYMYKMFDWAPLSVPDEATGDYQSVDFIGQQLDKKHDQPFFLACGIYRPHLPWFVPRAYFDLFPLDKIQLPPMIDNDTADLGNRARELIQRGGNYHKHVLEAGQWKKAIQGYLASVAYADAMVGELLDRLEKSAYRDNTIVVIWSDHGWQLGQKMHWRKFALWENVIKTVMMFKVPPGISALPAGTPAGKSTENTTSLLDLYPTLTKLCNLPDRPDLDGQSLIPLLENPDSLILRPILTTYDYGDYSVRYDHWHYIHYIDGSEELYDLNKDPEEWYNLADSITYATIKQQLASYLPKKPQALPESSLIELQEHHIPPVKSKAYYESEERKNWLRRFFEF